MTIRKRNGGAPPFEQVAGNGLLDRRALLGRGIMLAGAAATGVGASLTSAAAEPLKDDPWSLEMGSVSLPRQVPSRFEKHVVRTLSNPNNEFRNSHGAHAAPSAQRHDHADGAALHHLPLRPAGYRSGEAPAGDPRPGQAAEDLLARRSRRAIRW